MSETPQVDSRVLNSLSPKILHSGETDIIQDHQRPRFHNFKNPRHHYRFEGSIFWAINEYQIRVCKNFR